MTLSKEANFSEVTEGILPTLIIWEIFFRSSGKTVICIIFEGGLNQLISVGAGSGARRLQT